VRSLSADEKALWERVAATIRPLSREPINSPSEVEEGSNTTAVKIQPGASRPGPRPAPTQPPKREGLSTQTLDSSWDRRLRSGDVQPDRVIDLHGMTLDRAWSAIAAGLDRALAGGDRVILLITGHARPGGTPVQRGKIRAAVHDWLEASRHASRIAAVRGAHGRHGGGGSLYIILRRDRPKSTLS
jgi:DNA-nicking Smr family endonuclease